MNVFRCASAAASERASNGDFTVPVVILSAFISLCFRFLVQRTPARIYRHRREEERRRRRRRRLLCRCSLTCASAHAAARAGFTTLLRARYSCAPSLSLSLLGQGGLFKLIIERKSSLALTRERVFVFGRETASRDVIWMIYRGKPRVLFFCRFIATAAELYCFLRLLLYFPVAVALSTCFIIPPAPRSTRLPRATVYFLLYILYCHFNYNNTPLLGFWTLGSGGVINQVMYSLYKHYISGLCQQQVEL